MDKKIAGLLGGVSALALTQAQASPVSPAPLSPLMQATSYADLLQPIPNALDKLAADAAMLEEAQYYPPSDQTDRDSDSYSRGDQYQNGYQNGDRYQNQDRYRNADPYYRNSDRYQNDNGYNNVDRYQNSDRYRSGDSDHHHHHHQDSGIRQFIPPALQGVLGQDQSQDHHHHHHHHHHHQRRF